jgi:hypothetical protein
MREAYRNRGEDKPGEWRCPGCQRHRLHVPQSYMYVVLAFLILQSRVNRFSFLIVVSVELLQTHDIFALPFRTVAVAHVNVLACVGTRAFSHATLDLVHRVK